jgi:aspartoacylase
MADSYEKIQNVAIVGGTHGNELTGVEIVKRYMEQPAQIERETLNVKTLLANPNAIKLCRRYDEKDLNRCFEEANLNSTNSATYEDQRAKEIVSILGGRSSEDRQDLIIDIHNSTAEMKFSLIFSRLDVFSRKLYAHLIKQEPEIRLYYMPEVDRENAPYLPTIGKRDICLEVGAQAHGVLIGSLYERTKELVELILDFSNQWNKDPSMAENNNLVETVIYEHQFNLDFPRYENGELSGYVHPALQFKDYSKVEVGQPLFKLFDGSEVLWKGQEDLTDIYPVFINENAYYEKGVAMSLTVKKDIKL